MPLGDSTSVSITSDWHSPSFQGAFLPRSREVGDQGFSAEWQVLGLGRGFPSVWNRAALVARSAPTSASGDSVMSSVFGVDLTHPLSVHATTLRASKYGVLFIGMTLVALFLFEIFKKLRLHAMHYLSVGMGNVIFYLLLLALAEHFGFGMAYAVSASASTLLISGYAIAILGGSRRALPIAALLSGTYLQLYMVLNAEDFAVLIGAVSLFALLATFMYLTRRVDWFGLDMRSRDVAVDDA